MKLGYISLIVAAAFVMTSGLAETAVAAKTKKLTYEQAWEACKKEMDKMGVFGTSTQAVERHTRGAACMKRYGHKI
jgi:2-hydroxychromene-2-carboxylate isomerase